MYYVEIPAFSETEDPTCSPRREDPLLCQMGIMAGRVTVLEVPHWLYEFVVLCRSPVTIM